MNNIQLKDLSPEWKIVEMPVRETKESADYFVGAIDAVSLTDKACCIVMKRTETEVGEHFIPVAIYNHRPDKPDVFKSEVKKIAAYYNAEIISAPYKNPKS